MCWSSTCCFTCSNQRGSLFCAMRYETSSFKCHVFCLRRVKEESRTYDDRDSKISKCVHWMHLETVERRRIYTTFCDQFRQFSLRSLPLGSEVRLFVQHAVNTIWDFTTMQCRITKFLSLQRVKEDSKILIVQRVCVIPRRQRIHRPLTCLLACLSDRECHRRSWSAPDQLTHMLSDNKPNSRCLSRDVFPYPRR